MRQFIKVLVAVLIVLYPISIYFGLNYFSPSQIGLFILAIFLLRIFVLSNQPRQKSWQLIMTVMVGVILAGLTWIYNTAQYLLWYPVGLNLAFFVVFGMSLIYPPTVIERLARAMDGPLSENAIRYTRNVTLVWSVFFVLNAGIAAWTVLLNDMKIWTLYNGLIAYVAMGILFVAELLIRRHVRER